MDRVIYIALFTLPLLCFVFQAVEGDSGTVLPPKNGALKTFPGSARKCFVLQWTAEPCKTNDSICRTSIELTTRDSNGATTIEKKGFFPPTAADNRTHYQCIYDTASESNTCCSELVSGLTQAMTTSLDKATTVEMLVKNCLNYSGNCASVGKPGFVFVTPWRDPCHLSNPCGLNALKCQAYKPDSYNCTCSSNWEGVNCTALKGFITFKDKCFGSSVEVIKSESNFEADTCGLRCKTTDGCRSFVFIPDKAGSKTGICKVYKSTSQDNKLESCSGSTYYEMTDVPTTTTTTTTKQPNGAAVIGYFYPVFLAVLANIMFSFM